MEASMNKAQLLSTLKRERSEWESLLSQFDEHEMIRPAADGEWSVKDIVAHVTYYERWLLNWLEDAVRGKVTVATHKDEVDVDARNALIFAENKDRSVQDVLAESRQVFEQVFKLVELLPEQDLLDPHRFDRYVVPFWKRSEPLWQCIAGDTYEHYRQHLPTLRARRESQELQLAGADALAR
jgi:hypothetical protein